MTRSFDVFFDVFFDLRLNKWSNKHARRRWFDTPSHPLWCRSRLVEYCCGLVPVDFTPMYQALPQVHWPYTINNYHIDAGTKWPPFCRRYFQIHFFKIYYIFLQISLSFVLFNNKPQLVLLMASRRTCSKPLSEPVMVKFINVCLSQLYNCPVLDKQICGIWGDWSHKSTANRCYDNAVAAVKQSII